MWYEYIALLLSVPVVMIITGIIMVKKPPKEINSLIGYRTKRSMKNISTWNFAQKLCGDMMKKHGITMAICSMLIFCVIQVLEKQAATDVCMVVLMSQLIVLLCVPVITEQELENTFDSDGQLR